MNVEKNEPRLIALDWGTSSLRAYLLGASATILAERSLPAGIMHLDHSAFDVGKAFEKAFQEACSSWLARWSSLPVIASGMVGSAEGWCEAPYLRVPIDIFEIVHHLTQFESSTGNLIHIVPGLIRRGDLVNVMRGEETQILGAVVGGDSSSGLGEIFIGLPGTHSKWARVTGTCIQDFETFMTGEIYAAICKHTILGRTMKLSSSFQMEAFDRGVQVAQSTAGRRGVLSNIFSVRTFALTGQLTAEQQSDYLSGLIIGHEINALSTLNEQAHHSSTEPLPIVLIGEPSLCTRYRRALELHSYRQVTFIADATIRGLWQIASQASLINRERTSSTLRSDGPQLC